MPITKWNVPWRPVVAALVALALVALTACGGSDDAESGTEEASGGDADAFIAEAGDAFEKASAEQTTEPPAEGPEAQEGKKIVIIPCSMAAEGCARPARAAQEAADTIGWDVSVIDPAGDANKIAEAVQKATAQQADGIVLEAIDADHITEPLNRAKAAGINVVSFAATNEGGGLDWTVPNDQQMEQDGYLSGQASFHLAEGDLKLVAMEEDFYGVDRLRQEGLERFMDDCGAAGAACELMDTETFQLPTMATQGSSQAAALARGAAGFNVFWANFDAALTFFVEGLQQAGVTDGDSFAFGFDANTANLDDIRDDGYQRATIGLPMTWIGYAQIDTLNRLFAGEKPVDQGIRSKLLTADNVPPEGAWDGDIDVKPAYESLWGQ